MRLPSPDSWPKGLQILIKALAILAVLLVSWQSLISVGQGGSIPHMDKLVHLAVYFVLAAMIRLGWWTVWGGFILIFCTVLGFGLEFLQGTIAEGRTMSLADGIANMIGAVLALYLVPRIWR